MDEYKSREEANKVMDAFGDYVNSYRWSKEDLCAAFDRQHRTLQQNMIRGFIAILKHLAQRHSEGRYDDRNVDACEFAKQVLEKVDSKYLYLRHI